MMKRLMTIGLLVTMLAGCGRGWLPLYRGAPCEGCGPFRRPLLGRPLVARPDGPCTDCQNAAGYSTYDGQIAGGEYIEEELPPTYYDEGTVVAPRSGTGELTPLPAPQSGT